MFNFLSIDIFLLVSINVSILPHVAVAWRKQIFIFKNMIKSEQVPKSEKKITSLVSQPRATSSQIYLVNFLARLCLVSIIQTHA